MRPPKAPARSRTDLWRRIVIYGVLVLVLATAQCSFFASLHVLPATPDLMLSLVLAILLLDEPRSALAVAIGGGFLVDALGANGTAFSPIFYLTVVLALAVPASKMLSRFLSFCVLLLPSLVLRALYTAVCLWVHRGALPTLSGLLQILLPELLLTALLALLIYPLVRLCRRPIGSRKSFRF